MPYAANFPTKLPRPDALQAADLVLDRLVVSSDALTGGDVGVEMFLNNREKGYAVLVDAGPRSTVTICFSEYRNSDEIVVYVSLPGEDFDFDGLGSAFTPTDRAFAGKRLFRRNDYRLAAAYVQEQIDAALAGGFVAPEDAS